MELFVTVRHHFIIKNGSSTLSNTEAHRQVSCSLSGELWCRSEISSLRSWVKNKTNRSFWDDIKMAWALVSLKCQWHETYKLCCPNHKLKKGQNLRWGLKTLQQSYRAAHYQQVSIHLFYCKIHCDSIWYIIFKY